MKRMDANQHNKLTFLEEAAVYIFANWNINEARSNLI